MTELAFAFEDPFAFAVREIAIPAADKAAQRAPDHSLELSQHDLTLLRCASNGMVDKSIANTLRCEADHVHQQWRRIRRLLGANDRSHAVAIALSLGIIPAPDRALVLAALQRRR